MLTRKIAFMRFSLCTPRTYSYLCGVRCPCNHSNVGDESFTIGAYRKHFRHRVYQGNTSLVKHVQKDIFRYVRLKIPRRPPARDEAMEEVVVVVVPI